MVTDEDVRLLISTDKENLSPFIRTAESLYGQVLGLGSLPQCDEDILITWLSAHYIAVADGQIKKATGLRWSTEYYEGQLGKGLESTFYGQQAIALDTTGKLRDLGKEIVFSMESL